MEVTDASKRRPHMAIVEDENELVRIYEMILAKMGIPVCFVAGNGMEAVELFCECVARPRVVLMDNRLPGMNGVEATRRMLAAEPETRVIFLSADSGSREEAIKAGAFIFLSKPANIRDIVGAVERALGPSPAAVALPDLAAGGVGFGW